MAVHVTLDEGLIYPQTGSIRVTRSVGARSTCEFKIRATKATLQHGQEVSVYDMGKRIFGGRVQTVELSPIVQASGSEAWYDVTCSGWEARLEEIKVKAESFEKKYAGEIIRLLLGKYIDNDVFIGDIQNGAPPEELMPPPYEPPLVLKGQSLAAVLDDLALRSNYIWYITPARELYFTPRDYVQSALDINVANRNYREPVVRYDRADYFNRIKLAISLDAFTPLVLELPGDQTWPDFLVYDPADPEKKPLPIEAIREITLNGAHLEFAIWGAEEGRDLYWQQGSAKIRWDEAAIEPTTEDVVRVEFYPLGMNIIEKNAGDSLTPIQGDSGIVEAYVEDDNIKDITQGIRYCEEFLHAHCPALQGGHAGEVPSEYSWTMFSHELFREDSNTAYVEDIMPGRLIWFYPSTPIVSAQNLIIQEVTAEHIEKSHSLGQTGGMFKYTIKAILYPIAATYMEFYRALAEVPLANQGVREFPSPVLDTRAIIFGIPSVSVTGDIGWYTEITIPTNQVFRPTAAYISAHTAPSGASFMPAAQYSTDGGTTWTEIFRASDDGERFIELSADAHQLDEPWTLFNGPIDPATGLRLPLNIPARSLIRCGVLQTGSAADVLLQIVGEIRRAGDLTTTDTETE